MKKVFVTGAGGYLGIPLCETLLNKGNKVVALDRFFFGYDKIKSLEANPNISFLKDDIRYVDTSFLKDVDVVIDLAGLSNDATAEIDPLLTEDINHKGAMRIAEAARNCGVKRYIYSSSASVYGAGKKTALTEKDNVAPLTQYAKSKLAVENDLKLWQNKDFEVVILRSATLYGLAPRMRFDLAINIMTMRAWKELNIYIMGGGEQWRPFVHVNDVIQAFMLCMEAPSDKVNGAVFNVGSNEQNYQIKNLAQFVLHVVPKAIIHRIPDDTDNRSYNLNFDKITNVLGFKPRFNVNDGIIEIKDALDKALIDPSEPTCFTLQWYKSLIEWETRIKDLSFNNKII